MRSRASRRRGLWSWLVPVSVVATAVPASGQAPAFTPPRHFAIENARIVTVSGATIERGTIVIENGLIAAVGENVSVPPEAWVIDGSGLTVYPGLIDALSTVGVPESMRNQERRRGGGPGGGGGLVVTLRWHGVNREQLTQGLHHGGWYCAAAATDLKFYLGCIVLRAACHGN